jgi:hypothetical protein
VQERTVTQPARNAMLGRQLDTHSHVALANRSSQAAHADNGRWVTKGPATCAADNGPVAARQFSGQRQWTQQVSLDQAAKV